MIEEEEEDNDPDDDDDGDGDGDGSPVAMDTEVCSAAVCSRSVGIPACGTPGAYRGCRVRNSGHVPLNGDGMYRFVTGG
jgi:hypothetical protein